MERGRHFEHCATHSTHNLMVSRFTVLAFLCLIPLGCQPVQKEVYRFKGGTRPVFTPDPSKQIEWVTVATEGEVIIEDGPEIASGVFAGGAIYKEGGVVGFTTGTTESRKPLSIYYEGAAYTRVE